MEIKLDNCFTIRAKNNGDLLNLLLQIHGFTKQEFADLMEISIDTVKSWVRNEKKVSKYALRYLLDTLELELRLIGYMSADKKFEAVYSDISNIQNEIVEARMEDDTIKQNILDVDIKESSNVSKPIKISMLAQIALIQKEFLTSK